MRERVGNVLSRWIPRGERIGEESFAERHRILTGFLALHLPVLFVFGIWMNQDVWHVAAELVTPVTMAVVACSRRVPQRLRGLATTAGLVYVSAVVVHFSGGTIEAHFHFFIILGFIALYQDWLTFAWAIVFTLLSHGIMGTIDPATMYNHEAALDGPWKWAAIHAAAVALAAVGQLLHWRFAELERARSADLSRNLAEERHRSSLVRLYVNLARRNRGLLGQQVEAIDALEAQEQDPDTLERLFRLDHVTARLRRHTDSLLVLANQQTSRSWSGPVALRDVVRAATGDVEEYQRVDIMVHDEVSLSGPVVSDVTHLLTELIENALSFSPPNTTVLVGSHAVSKGHVLVVEDGGIGMTEDALQAANRKLVEVTALEDGLDPQLGLHVVARLADKHGIQVRLRPGRGAGTMAMVFLPSGLCHRPSPADDGHGAAGATTQRRAPGPAEVPTPPPSPAPPAAAATEPAPAAEPAPATEPAPTTEPAPAAEPAPTTSGTRLFTSQAPSLPQRVPGQATGTPATQPIPGAFGNGGERTNGNGHTDVATRSQRLSSFQAGTRAARNGTPETGEGRS